MNYLGTVRGRLGIAADRALFTSPAVSPMGGSSTRSSRPLQLPEERSMPALPTIQKSDGPWAQD